ncbi:unnamed protein product [Chrysoparadoxa australica]
MRGAWLVLLMMPYRASAFIAVASSLLGRDRMVRIARGRTLEMGKRGRTAQMKPSKKRRRQLPEVPIAAAVGGGDIPGQPKAKPRAIRKCQTCLGTAKLTCSVCAGTGIISATGFSKRNKVSFQRVQGSKFTSVYVREGHRHYFCNSKIGKNGKTGKVEMVNACGPQEERCRLVVPFEQLKDKSEWRMSWVTLEEIRNGMPDERDCNVCGGACSVACSDCNATGLVGLEEGTGVEGTGTSRRGRGSFATLLPLEPSSVELGLFEEVVRQQAVGQQAGPTGQRPGRLELENALDSSLEDPAPLPMPRQRKRQAVDEEALDRVLEEFGADFSGAIIEED